VDLDSLATGLDTDDERPVRPAVRGDPEVAVLKAVTLH
jgi:hypothetical protein